MACRVADTEQDWFVLLLRLLQGFFAPRIPIYRVMGVLQEVRAGLVDEPIGMFILGCRVCGIGHDSSGGRYYILFLVFLDSRVDEGIVPYKEVGGLSIAYFKMLGYSTGAIAKRN